MDDSTNYCCQKQRHNFHSSSQIRCKYVLLWVWLLLPYLNTPISKAWGSASRAQRPLTTGIVRWQFPSLRGTTWRNNGRSAWNGSRFEHICAFYAEITSIQGVKLKMSCYNCDEDRSVGVCCPNALGLVRTVRQIPRATPSGFDFLFRTRPRALGQQTPPEPVLIP